MKARRRLTATGFNDMFGPGSCVYVKARSMLMDIWKTLQERGDASKCIKTWGSLFREIYGNDLNLELFINHTYLDILVKVTLFVYLEPESGHLTKEDITDIVNGAIFERYGICNLVSDNFSTWVLRPDTMTQCRELINMLINNLLKFDLRMKGDIFRVIYEELVERSIRRRKGEYNTPEWLSQLTLKEALGLINTPIPRILDPACGTGTFIRNAIIYLKERLAKMDTDGHEKLNTILTSVVGIDINPMAVLISKVNYILALRELLNKGPIRNVRVPIYMANSLTDQSSQIGTFDIVVGNPPWITLRDLKRKTYQDFLKKEMLKYKLVNRKDTHLFTQLELATLFFCRCADIYLRRGGVIAFVMPKSVIAGTLHHENFRRFEKPLMKLVKILDLEGVKPLFNMPSCVLIAIKGGKTTYPVAMEIYTANLPDRDVELNDINHILQREKLMYVPPQFPIKRSYYYDKFKVGASIFPRSLYFVDILSLGSEGRLVHVRTSEDILRKAVKDPWKVVLEGYVEPDFLYVTILAWEIVPFGYIRFRPVVLPVLSHADSYEVLDVYDLKKRQMLGMARWLEKAQAVWEKRRTEASRLRFPRLIDRLNYNNLLSAQNPNKRYVVLYGATGSYITSCVIDRKSPMIINAGGKTLRAREFIADVKTWFYETNDKAEAHYLAALLNSRVLDRLIKPLQPRGIGGPRAIHRRPFLFPIPKFDRSNNLHRELATISMTCHDVVRELLKENTPIVSREYIRTYLKDEIEKIDDLVVKIIEERRSSEHHSNLTSWLSS